MWVPLLSHHAQRALTLCPFNATTITTSLRVISWICKQHSVACILLMKKQEVWQPLPEDQQTSSPVRPDIPLPRTPPQPHRPSTPPPPGRSAESPPPKQRTRRRRSFQPGSPTGLTHRLIHVNKCV